MKRLGFSMVECFAAEDAGALVLFDWRQFRRFRRRFPEVKYRVYYRRKGKGMVIKIINNNASNNKYPEQIS